MPKISLPNVISRHTHTHSSNINKQTNADFSVNKINYFRTKIPILCRLYVNSRAKNVLLLPLHLYQKVKI